jgi:hypothetical protein
MIPRQRVEKQEPIRMPSSIKDLKITPRARKPTSTPMTNKPKPKPRAKAYSYKGINQKFDNPSIGLGFKGARQLKAELKLKEAIKERKEEEPKKKRGRPKKEVKQKTLRERKESEENFKAKKSSYESRIDRYITNQYKNGMIIESKDPKVHYKVLEYCLSKKPKRMTAKLLSEAFNHVMPGSHLRDSKGFGLYT